MKRPLIVFFDLTEPAINREALVKKIKSYGKWTRLGDSAYLIATDEAPIAVRNKLDTVLDDEDRIYVGVVSAPSAWTGMPEAVSKWILSNQK
jgi:hypothetical protein